MLLIALITRTPSTTKAPLLTFDVFQSGRDCSQTHI